MGASRKGDETRGAEHYKDFHGFSAQALKYREFTATEGFLHPTTGRRPNRGGDGDEPRQATRTVSHVLTPTSTGDAMGDG